METGERVLAAKRELDGTSGDEEELDGTSGDEEELDRAKSPLY